MPGLTAGPLDDAALERLFAPIAGMGTVGLAVSGGPDSLALMVLAARWRQGRAEGPRLIVYTLDHGLRPEAAGEVAMVVAAAARFGLEARALAWRGERPGSGVQSAARAARYRLIGQAMAVDGAQVLMTAHHAEDQRETVLMRLAHGSGLDGLAGMRPFGAVLGVELFRPLLGVSRQTLLDVVAASDLKPVHDPSNADTHYERVRWRAALPAMTRLGLDAGRVGAFARRAQEAAEAIDLWTDEAWTELASVHPLGAIRLDRSGFARLPRAVATRLLSRVVAAAGGGGRPFALAPVEHAVRAIAGEERRGLTLLGAELKLRKAEIWACREAGRLDLGPIVLGPRSAVLWDARFEIRNLTADTAFDVTPARQMTRARAEAAIGHSLELPIAAIRSAPLIMTQNGDIAALGALHADGRLDVAPLCSNGGANAN